MKYWITDQWWHRSCRSSVPSLTDLFGWLQTHLHRLLYCVERAELKFHTLWHCSKYNWHVEAVTVIYCYNQKRPVYVKMASSHEMNMSTKAQLTACGPSCVWRDPRWEIPVYESASKPSLTHKCDNPNGIHIWMKCALQHKWLFLTTCIVDISELYWMTCIHLHGNIVFLGQARHCFLWCW